MAPEKEASYISGDRKGRDGSYVAPEKEAS